MSKKSKRPLSILMAVTMTFVLFAAMPLTASADDSPIQVTMNPVGAIYVLNQTAVPIKATFAYDALADLGTIDSATTIKVRWYWSLDNSNTSRVNGFEESTVEYSRRIEHQTTLTPATNEPGVKYYYAVMSYAASVQNGNNWEAIPAEAVTEPARIEVIAPEPPEHDFQVKKVDENGNPLAGAVFSLVPDKNNTWGEAESYEATSNAAGLATFTVTEGAYILSEEKAPSGYNATDDTYVIWVQGDQIMEVVDLRTQNFKPYETITFVNKPIPTLITDDHFAYMQGYPEGDFRPARNMTRAEAVVMFSRLLRETMDMSENHRNNYYPDVPSTKWYSNEVGYMQSRGVLADYSRDGRFRGDEPVTRAEFATLATHFDNITLTDTNIFPDVPADHWAVKYINSAAAKGWIVGDTEGKFRPEANITRAEVVTMVNRMLNRTADEEYLTANLSSLPRHYSDLTSAHWAYLAIMESSIGHDYIRDGASEHWTKVYP